jgi:hypothetical protein
MERCLRSGNVDGVINDETWADELSNERINESEQKIPRCTLGLEF